VVAADREPARRESLVLGLAGGDGREIHDLTPRRFEEIVERRPLRGLVHGAPDLEDEVRPATAEVDDLRVAHAQRGDDVAHDVGRGGRGQREDRRAPERLGGAPDAEIGGPEVMTPLRDAVRLVDGEEARPRGGERLELARLLQALGRDVDELALAPTDLRHLRRSSRAVSVELRVAASTAASLRCSCWSFMSAMSGETTITGPSRKIAGSW